MSLPGRRIFLQRELSQRGLSLVELMVALAIGGFLMLGVVNVFLSTRESSQLETSLARLQENGRFAMDLLYEDLRHAHYMGCNSVASDPEVMATDVRFDGIRGYERRDNNGTLWMPALPASGKLDTLADGNLDPRDGSDILNMQIGMRQNSSLTAAVTPTSTALAIDNNPGCALEQGDLVTVASCLTAHLFRITNTQSCDTSMAVNATTLEFDATGNSETSMEPGYDTDAEIMLFQDVTWFVADTTRDRNGYDVYALYRMVNGGRPDEMIEGVEHMQLLFGQRMGGGTRFVPARSLADEDYDEVTGVRIGFLVQSFEPVRDNDDTRTYRLLDENIDTSGTTAMHSGGRAMRQVFQATAVLRNTPFDR